jgi:hypothetical protein
MNYTRKELLALPERDFDKETIYDTIAIVPSGKKHDSGYALIAIIGFDENSKKPVEIAAYCDDIGYCFPEGVPVQPYNLAVLRTDMFYPSGIAHVWSNGYRFKVGESLSSTDVHLVPKEGNI